MNDERVERVAHTHAARLGIGNDATAHVGVGLLIKVGMHHASTRLDNRHARRIAHKVDKFLSATWYAEVDISHRVEHIGRGLVSGGQQAHNIGADAFVT